MMTFLGPPRPATRRRKRASFDEFGGEAPNDEGETPWEARERRACRNQPSLGHGDDVASVAGRLDTPFERKAARKQKLKEKQREAQAKKAGKATAKRPAAEDDDSDDDRDYDVQIAGARGEARREAEA